MFDRYVGVPWIEKGREFEGCDCWGLLRLLYLNERGISVPSYSDSYENVDDRATLTALIRGEVSQSWGEIARGAEQIFDAVLMREGRALSHVGVVVAPGKLLHVERGGTSVIEPYRHGPLKHRVIGFYRFVGP